MPPSEERGVDRVKGQKCPPPWIARGTSVGVGAPFVGRGGLPGGLRESRKDAPLGRKGGSRFQVSCGVTCAPFISKGGKTFAPSK